MGRSGRDDDEAYRGPSILRPAGRGVVHLGGSDESIGARRPRTTSVGFLLFVVLAAVYVVTANFSGLQVNDTRAAAIGAWSVAERQTLAMPVGWIPSSTYWAVEGTDGAFYPNRFPAMFAVAAPVYAAAGWLGVLPDTGAVTHPFLVPMWPAAVAAALVTAGGIAVMYLVLLRLATPRRALIAAGLLALGTPVWSVAADALWPHGISLLAIALTLLLASAPTAVPAGWRRTFLSVVGAAGLVLTRPHLLVVPSVLAVGLWAQDRRVQAGWLGAGAVAGAGGLVAYSQRIFGTWLPAAGYESDGFLSRLVLSSPWTTVQEIIGALFHPSRGVLLITPALLVLLPWVREGWRASPPWVRHASIGSVLYLVLQFRMTRWTGGTGFAGYRTSLEGLVLAVPLLLRTYEVAIAPRRWWRLAFFLLAFYGLVMTAIAAVNGGASEASQQWWERSLTQLEQGIDPLTPPPTP